MYDLRSAPILILANKQDLPNAMKPEEIHEELKRFIESSSRSWAVYGVSASQDDKQSTGHIEAFDWLSDALVTTFRKEEVRNWLPNQQDVNNNLTEKHSTKKTIKTESVFSSIMKSVKSLLYSVPN